MPYGVGRDHPLEPGPSQASVAGNVSVVGDFNGWDPFAHPLRPRRDGTRSAVVTLPPGRRFAYRYLAEGGRWHDDPTAEAFEPNGIGGHNAIIHTLQALRACVPRQQPAGRLQYCKLTESAICPIRGTGSLDLRRPCPPIALG